MPDLAFGLTEALNLLFTHTAPLGSERVALPDSVDRVVAGLLPALVNSPSVTASLKDGYAVRAEDVAHAGPVTPVTLRLLGSAAAGERHVACVEAGTAYHVLTGARIPAGATAVVANEFASHQNGAVIVRAPAEPGRNILPEGFDVLRGSAMAEPGQIVTPGLAGLLAAAGYDGVDVVRAPRVAVLATGDEVVAPGQPLPEGRLYASNITTLAAWCRRYRMESDLAVVPDDADEIARAITRMLTSNDALVTSGGAWTGDRDLVASILDDLGWQCHFHRIRIGPGKAVGFGVLNAKPVFVLPGGPPSNLMGFLQIALPGLLRLAGHRRPDLPRIQAHLSEDLAGSHATWTQFVFGTVEATAAGPRFHQMPTQSRLQSMADAQAIVAIPEGETLLKAGSIVSAQLLT